MIISYFASLLMAAMLAVVGIPLPVSMPPRPEDPALARIAPADAIAFVSWSGAAPADPDSDNRAERLAAEPEVRALVTALHEAMLGALGSAARGPAAGLLQRTVAAVTASLQQPGCAFVQQIGYDPRPHLAAGIAVRLDDRMAAAKGVLGAMELALRAGLGGAGGLHEDQEVDGLTFHALPIQQQFSFVGWAETDGWLLVAIGEETPAHMVAGLRGDAQGLSAAANFAQLRAKCAVARPAARCYVDAARLYEVMRASGAGDAVELMTALGLGRATAAMATTGLEGEGSCYRLRVLTPAHEGLLGVLDGPPLGVDDLLLIPRDADLAFASRVDALACEQHLLDVFAAMVGPAVRAEYEREFVAEFRENFGVRWREDLLAHVGDQVVLWDAPSQGGALFTAAAGAVALQDGEAFGAAMSQVMTRLAELAPNKAATRAADERLGRGESYLETFEAAGETVWWVDAMDDDVPFAPAWAVADRHLLAGLMPQAVRSTLAAGDAPNPDESLLRLPELSRRGRATAMLHLDLQGVVERGYPALLMVLQMAGREWQRDGFDFDLADLPAPRNLLPHLGRELTLVEPVADGWAVTRTGTLPVVDPLTVTLVGVITGLLVRV